MTKHTPGPWEWVVSNGRLIGHPSPEQTGVGSPIILDLDPVDWAGGRIREADARLIASAPELLNACQVAFVHLQTIKDGGTVPEARSAEKMLDWAIAKATGQPDE